MARPAPPSDDGSPARLIATMIGVVGILLLGSLAWSAVGALVSAVGAAGTALTSVAGPRPVATFTTPAAVLAAAPTPAADTPTPLPVSLSPTADATSAPRPVAANLSPTPDVPTPVPASLSPTPDAPTATPQPARTPTAVAAGRNPWILLPQPEPGARIAAGPVTVEARGRGDVPITGIALELDGGSLPVQIEQRSDSIWRGFASTRVSAGPHSVHATVTDASGRSGSYRWTFTAGSPP